MSRLLEQLTDGVLDTEDLRAEGIDAHLVGDLQCLSEVLVGFAQVDVLALAIVDCSAELFGDGFGEVVVGCDDDVVVVPWEIGYCEACEEENAGAMLAVLGLWFIRESIPAHGKWEQYWVPIVILLHSCDK